MSIAFTLVATDGVVLVADGRTTSVPIGNDPDAAPKTDVAIKVTVAPYGLPFAIAYTGRGGIDGTPMNDIVGGFLLSFTDTALAALPLGDLLANLREHLHQLTAAVPAMYQDGTSEPVHLLVAGHRSGSEDLEVWKSVGPKPEQVSRVDNHLVFCGLPVAQSDGQSAEDRVLVLFDDEYRVRQSGVWHVEDDYYLLRDMTMAQVVEYAVAKLSADINEDPEPYTGDGIGGVWRLVSVSPTGATNVDCFHIGPMLVGDARPAGSPCDES
ncbi:hypothetical protein E1212_25230 [Jiangella ureilytica]|uniref:Uncharacterized protein n=1 Tax=Jiangella ureilytica TaxID=2530374 RepID=A0A4R4RD49_9ACTN|nr:hypothetical protein [Jiangella ureilytica]TDC47090.1 hypothetical protein E1212_25230 [Jiangella ureilytica]